jgi:hypothetical protein
MSSLVRFEEQKCFHLLQKTLLPTTTLALYVVVNSEVSPGANLTTASYNASTVKIYNATSSLVRFENEKRFHLLQNTIQLTTTLALLF